MKDMTLAALATMLNGFPQQAGTDPRLLMKGFQMALEGIREDAIQETSLRYMTGMIEGQDTRFAPSIPQFVVEAKKRQGFMIAVEQYNATPKLASAPVDDAPRVSPEKMQALADWFHGKIDGDELARITGTIVSGA